mmetsp:Transcript_8136/g.25418  ORF Transcript_8136/g.25418 Transcript_8136/m.25418 type:complete len:162 (+) Transcript_8136:850-1335(+)
MTDGGDFDFEQLVGSIGSLDAVLVFLVSMGGKAAEVEALVRRGASPRTSLLGCGPVLSISARRCSREVTRLLLEARAEVDEKDSRGWTPLMHAIDAHSADNPREATITLLLDKGAAIDVWSHDLRGPLDLMSVKDVASNPIKHGIASGSPEARRMWENNHL